jgi:hypothetical protein
MAFWIDDLPYFYNDFYYTATFGGATIKVWMEEAYAERMVDGIPVEVHTLISDAEEADMATAKQGDSIVINGKTYYIIDPKPNGTGMIEFQLSEVAVG